MTKSKDVQDYELLDKCIRVTHHINIHSKHTLTRLRQLTGIRIYLCRAKRLLTKNTHPYKMVEQLIYFVDDHLDEVNKAAANNKRYIPIYFKDWFTRYKVISGYYLFEKYSQIANRYRVKHG